MSDAIHEHSVVSLMGIVALGGVAVIALTAYTGVTLARWRRASAPRLPSALRGAAALTGAAAAACYAWAAVRLLGVDITEHVQLCQDAVGPAHEASLVGYEATYVPLRFGCRVEGGGTYTAGVPEYANTAALVLALTAAVLTGAAALDARRRTARQAA
ncbi:hypothetical protein [Streptomyces sp. NPDC059063]|uniref:hypothetical protein n=1 Tax=unclassified Streptomyces TaxID=2593676 RepID=UPI0036AB4D4B